MKRDEFEKRKQDLINNIDNMLRNENWGEPDELGWRENKSFPGMKRREEGYTDRNLYGIENIIPSFEEWLCPYLLWALEVVYLLSRQPHMKGM